MKFGFNLILWTQLVTEEHEPIFRALKNAGYDGVELPLSSGDPDHYARLGEMLDGIGLERTAVGIFRGKSPISSDKASRDEALAFAKWALDCCAALGAPLLGGPLHSESGVFTGSPPTDAERKRALSFHKRAGDYAAKKGVTFALEALHRYECYFLNTMQQLCDYLDEVDHPHVQGLYDTFHANIEEKDPVGAIKTIRPHLVHVHIAENDRGTPGKGHVPWAETYEALKKAKYNGWLTIEAFSRFSPPLAAATHMWRDVSPSVDEVYKLGLLNMWDGWAQASGNSRRSAPALSKRKSFRGS